MSNSTGIPNTYSQLWLTESKQATPVDSMKDVVGSSRVRQTPEEGQRTYQLKHNENNHKDEGNSLKTLNDKKQSIRCFIHISLYIL